MNRFYVSLSFAAALAFLIGSVGVAQEAANPFSQYFKTIDKDGDGKIAKHEAPDRMKENFERIDADGDGYATLEELQQMFSKRMNQDNQGQRQGGPGQGMRPGGQGGPGQGMRPGGQGGPGQGMRQGGPGQGPGGQHPQLQAIVEKTFKMMDPNDDGKIEKDEAPEKMKEHFDTIDTDKNGEVTPEEMKVFITARLQAAMQQGQRPGGPGGSGGPGMRGPGMQGQRPGGPGQGGPGQGGHGQGSFGQRPEGQGQSDGPSRMVKMMLKNMDEDNDNMISEEEVRGPLKTRFDSLDTDGDGYLSVDELEKSLAAQSRRFGGGQRPGGPGQGGPGQGGPGQGGPGQGGPGQGGPGGGMPPMSAEAMISHMDTDNDGKLSKEEVRGPLQDHFDKVDKDSDGYLSTQELKDSLIQMMKQMRGGGQGGQGGRPGGMQRPGGMRPGGMQGPGGGFGGGSSGGGFGGR